MEPAPTPLRLHIITGVTLGVVFGGALIAVWVDGQRSLADYSATTRTKIDSFERRLTALESRMQTVESAAKIDTGALDALRADITALQTSDAEIKAEIKDAMAEWEKQPAPAPVEAPKAATSPAAIGELSTAVKSGEPYEDEMKAWAKSHPKAEAPLLRAHASTGIPTELSLREQFKTITTRLGTGGVSSEAAPPIIARINTHLAGLVSIRKTSDHSAAYATLREASDAPLEQLAAKIDALPDDAQAPFANWRTALKLRTEALAELSTLQDNTP